MNTQLTQSMIIMCMALNVKNARNGHAKYEKSYRRSLYERERNCLAIFAAAAVAAAAIIVAREHF